MDTIVVADQPVQNRQNRQHAASARRTIGVVTSLAVLLAVLVPAASSTAGDFVVDAGTLVRVDGTLLVLSKQESAEDHADHDSEGIVELTTLLPDQVRLITDDGVSIPISGGLPEDVETGDGFSGTLSVPTESIAAISDTIAEAISGEPSQAVVDVDSVVGQEIIEASDALDAPLAVDDATITPEVSAAISAVAHTLDVIVVRLPGDPVNVVTSDSDLQTLAGRLSGFWNSQTNGQVASIAITGAVRRIVSANACDPEAMWDEGAALFNQSTTRLWWESASRHMLVIAPKECGGGTGMGSVGLGLRGGLAYAAYNAPTFEQTVGHELGHNFSLRHSNSMQCDEVMACSDSEYADYYDVMGGGVSYNGAGNAQLPALNVSQKKRIGGLGGTDLVNVSLSPTATGATTTFTLKPASATSGVRGLQVVDPNTGAVYYVEYRSGTGIDAGSIYSRAVLPGYAPGLRMLRIRDNTTSAVLTRANSTGRTHYLAPGQSLVTLGSGATVLFSSNGPTAQVVVSLGSTTAMANPTISGAVKVDSRLTANAGTWSPTPATLAYQWLRNGTAIGGATASSYVLSLTDVSSKLSVKVTGATTGYPSVSRTSASTVAVPLAVQRFGGGDRYTTAILMSRTFDPGVGVLYVARGDAYPDALSAAPAAAAGGGPLLLVTTTELPAAVRTEIERLKPKKIVVVGSAGAVNEAVYNQLAKLTPAITRQGGSDRYASSRMIVDTAFGETGVDRVYLATGRNFPDALSASAAAGANNGAIILVDGLAGELDAATIALIRKLNPRDIVLAGGKGALSSGIESSAAALKLPGGTIRLSGSDRFSTSLALNNNGFATAGTVYIATGYNFPDALAGAPLAGANGAPLYVVPGDCVPQAMIAAIGAYKATNLVLLGGASILSTNVERLTPCAF